MIGIIHMGAAKTGSSTLQEFFHQPRAVARCRVFYRAALDEAARPARRSLHRPGARTDPDAAERLTGAFREACGREVARARHGAAWLVLVAGTAACVVWNAGEIGRLEGIARAMVFVVAHRVPTCAAWTVTRPACTKHLPSCGGESDALLETLNPHHFM